MSSSHSLTSIDVSEYDRIEAAMTESERGRWFLDAYLRRNRAHDTGILLDAIARLESVVTADRDSDQIGRLRGDVLDMAHAIARTKAEIAAINEPHQDQTRLGGASAALDAIVRSTERATSDILDSAEHIQEAAWTLRESGSDAALCDELDRHATAIYTACSFQDLTAQRTARIIHTQRYLEERLAAMMAIWGDAIDPVPAAPAGSRAGEAPADLCQSDVDRYIDMDGSSAEPIPPPSSGLGPVPDHLSVADDIVFLEATEALDGSGTFAIPEPTQPSEPEPAAPADDAGVVDPLMSGDVGEADVELGPPTDEVETVPLDVASEKPEFEPDAPVDVVAMKMALAADATSVTEPTDIASAFADIDALSEDEKRVLFS